MATLSIIRPLHRSYKTSIWVDLAMFVAPMAARPGQAEFWFCDAKLKPCTFEFGFCSAKLKLYTFEFGFLSVKPKLCSQPIRVPGTEQPDWFVARAEYRAAT